MMRIRTVVALACCLLGAGAMLVAHDSDRELYLSLAVVVLAGGVLVALRPMWAALAGRGVLWTALSMATLFSTIDRPAWAMTVAALAMCVALGVLGRPGDRATATFQPKHHGGPLTLALVLGFADITTLLLWSILWFVAAGVHAVPYALVLTGFAAAIAISLVGLYRLRAWGFLLNLAVNLAAVVLMLLDVFHLDVARLLFIVPAVAQVLIALPVLIAIVRRRPLTMPAPIARLAVFVPATTLAVMAALNVQVWFGVPALRLLVRWGMHHL